MRTRGHYFARSASLALQKKKSLAHSPPPPVIRASSRGAATNSSAVNAVPRRVYMGNEQFNKFVGELCFCFFSPRRRACLASQQPGELRDVGVAEEFLHLAHDSEVKLRAFLVFVALAFLSCNYVLLLFLLLGKRCNYRAMYPAVVSRRLSLHLARYFASVVRIRFFFEQKKHNFSHSECLSAGYCGAVLKNFWQWGLSKVCLIAGFLSTSRNTFQQ